MTGKNTGAEDAAQGAVPTERDPSATSLRLALRSLRYRNFRIYITGQGISMVGTWMQRVAMSWLVYRLTGSALLLGVVGFAGRIPTFALAPFAGVLTDRWNRRRILYATQTLSMLQALVLAVLVLTGTVAVWHVIALAAFLGLMDAFDIPARQAFFVYMIGDREDLGNAIALNSSTFNAARLVGPSIAGVLIAMLGEGPVFLLNGATYLSMIVALLVMDAPPPVGAEGRRPVLQNLREGFSFAFGFPPVRAILLLLALISLAGVPYVVLMPIFATDVLTGGAHTFGFLMGAGGLGALAGALYMAARNTVRGLGRHIVWAATLFGGGLVTFGASRSLWLSAALVAVVGFGMMVQTASSNTVLQILVGDEMRGRIMSIYTMAFIGMIPFGNLLAGVLAERIGAPATVMLGGAACAGGATLFALRLPRLREQVLSVYAERGILPEVARGIQSTTH